MLAIGARVPESWWPAAFLAANQPRDMFPSIDDSEPPALSEGAIRRRDRNTIPTMASNGDGARPDQTSELQLLVDSAPNLIHPGRPDGYLDFFNQTWLRYVGRALEDLQGWKWTAFIHPEDVEGIVAAVPSTSEIGRPSRSIRYDCSYGNPKPR